jgi:hypothetical protein
MTENAFRPSVPRLLGQCLVGCVFLLFASAIVTVVSVAIIETFAPERPDPWPIFARTIVALSAGSLVILLLVIIWLTYWATSRQGGRRQFGLVSLFLTTALLAAYLALVRSLVVGIWPGEPPLWGFATISFFAAFLLIGGFIPLLGWMDSLVWFAAWLVRTRFVQRWFFGRHAA